MGCKDIAGRTDDAGWRHVTLGSAEGRMGVFEADGSLFFQVQAIVMPLPADKDLLLPLMRELLEINLELAGAVRFGIGAKNVFALSAWPATDLSADRVAATIHFTMSIADKMDDQLKAKYGGTSKKRGAPAKAPG